MQFSDILFGASRRRMRQASERTNEQWIAELKGQEPDTALEDLRLLLLRALRFALKGRGRLTSADMEDFVQEGLIRILDNIDSFRGESRFLTWAQKIVVRIAFSEMRRRRWQEVSLDELLEGDERSNPLQIEGDQRDDPSHQTEQRHTADLIRRLINEELTERQKTALLAMMVHGLPMEEVARQMNTNRNALYKLLHDGRKRLQKALVERGINAEEILSDL
jgi:RNA polymerase sigma-70 factor (ECF subfamily)